MEALIVLYQIIIVLLITNLIVSIIKGVFMNEALAALKASIEALNTKIDSLPTVEDHTAEINEATAAVSAATKKLNQKFPQA